MPEDNLQVEEVAVTAIMNGSDAENHKLWKNGDRGIADRIENFYKKKYPDQTPATVPKEQEVILDARPETMSDEAQLSPEQQENLRVIKERWGPDFQANVAHVNHAAELFGVRENSQAMEFLDDSGLADDPEFLDAAANLGRIITEKGR